MPSSQQIIHSLKVVKLKGVSQLDELRLDEKPLTGLMGPNGCGKSTLLHALACCYQPTEGSSQQNFKFKDFFTPTSDSTWAGSKLQLTHSYRIQQTEHKNVVTEYRKDADRWGPRYQTRPERYVAYIGIRSCVPKIEEETYKSIITYVTERHQHDAADLIQGKMSRIFNRQYVELNILRANSGRRYTGLSLQGLRYSSLAMGAGEQRVLGILSEVFNAPRYGLILIDEIDLLLHTAAFKELLIVLHERAVEKNLQIIFTTHRETVLELTEIISIKHLHTVNGKTYGFSNTTPDAIRRLTGTAELALEIFVEDKLAQAVVEHEVIRAGLKRITSITQYGSAINCFTLAAGLLLHGTANFTRQLFLQDGDLYVTPEERQERIGKVLSGTEDHARERRQSVSDAIRTLKATNGIAPAPEAQIHNMIRTLRAPYPAEFVEIIAVAQDIHAVDDNHKFVNEILRLMNVGPETGLPLIIRAAALSPNWPHYVEELRTWLDEVAPNFAELNAA